jgi:hypothetical protein
MTITKWMQLDWLTRKAKELAENLENKGCNLVPCKKCPFNLEHEAQDSWVGYNLPNCMVQIIEGNLIEPRYVVEFGGVSPVDIVWYILDNETGEHTRRATPNAKDGFTDREYAEEIAAEWNKEDGDQ